MIEIRNLSVWFHSTGETYAVRDVNLTLEPGSRTVMIGETGSGKSVLIQAMLQLLPSTAHVSGEALLDGRDLLAMSEKEISKVRGVEIGYVPQGNGNALNPLMTVGYQVGEGLIEHRGMKRKGAIKKAVELLERFHLGNEENIAAAYPHTLSGGMRQRAMIAMGIALDAETIFADEPTKGLDEKRIEEVIGSFRNLKDQTLLCVTHDLRFARAIAQRVVVMYAATQLETSSCDEFFTDPLHPYSRALLDSQPENGFRCSIGFAPPKEVLGRKGCIFSSLCPHATERCQVEPPMFHVGEREVRCWLYEN